MVLDLLRRRCARFLLVVCLGLLGACGQRGPLYLPEPPAPAGEAPAAGEEENGAGESEA